MKKLKLAVIVPCFNEEKSLPRVLALMPKEIAKFEKIETIVVDDGSDDKTAKVAQEAGVKHLLIHKKRLGLAKAFENGLSKAVAMGVDIIVNIDGDGQYDPKEIPKIIKPILKKQADMVLGNRQIKKLRHMEWGKKIGNIIGSRVIKFLTGAQIQDASTGFRAFTRQTAQTFNLIANHTYTHETIIQATFSGFKIVEVPIQFKKRQFGQSKLINSVSSHIKTSAAIIVRTILIYKAFKYLISFGLGIMFLGFLGTLRFICFFLMGEGTGHVQSLIFSSILISIGLATIVMAILADLINLNRKLIEKSRKVN